jgi:hypothetical protein
MSKRANEFRIKDPDEGQSPDEELHRAMLSKQSASDASDIAAVGQAIAKGVNPEKAARMFASKSAIALLAKAGIISLNLMEN